MTLRTLTGGARWDEATRYEPPPPGNGIGGAPCPCARPHGLLYSDPACDAAYARAELVRTTAIATSAERPAWLEQDTEADRCPHGYTGPHSALGMTPRAFGDHCSGPGAWYPEQGE